MRINDNLNKTIYTHVRLTIKIGGRLQLCNYFINKKRFLSRFDPLTELMLAYKYNLR